MVVSASLCAGANRAAGDRLGGEARAADLAEIESLFNRVIRSAPHRFHVIAQIETVTRSWSDAEINEELRRQEKITAREDRSLKASELQKLRALRLDGIRKAHSGTNTWDVEVWVSGQLYRRDEVWTSIPHPSKRSFVYIGDTAFTNVPAFVVNRTVGSATIYTNAMQTPVEIDPIVWDGWGLEPPFHLPVIAVLADTNAIIPSRWDPLRPLGHLKLDASKASSLACGTHPAAELSVSLTNVAGEDVKCFHLKPRGVPAADMWDACYYVDASKPECLKRVELRHNEGDVQVSAREGQSADGWPLVFTSQIKDLKGRLRTTRVVYRQVEVDSVFDDWSTFAPVFPTNYIVEVSSGTGSGHRIQNPNKALPHSPSQAPSSLQTALMIIAAFVLLILPLVLLLRKSSH